MRTNIQRFKKYLKSEIKRTNNKLLMAAVVLFSLSWAFIGPIRGAEALILPRPKLEDKDIIVEQASNEFIAIPESYLLGEDRFISQNALTSLNTNDPEEEILEEELLPTIQNNALLAQSTPTTLISQKQRQEVITYTVQVGDVPSTIAASYGISLNTLLWANKLTTNTYIRPGDELIILPVTGILHRVGNNETVQYIANRYKGNADEIIEINDLPSDGQIQIGQKLIIPDGQMPIPVAPVTTRVATRSQVIGEGTGKSHSFPYGQCTWYVAQKRYVPWNGHAKSWLYNSAQYGFATGNTPQVGAIMVLTDGGWLGRVYGHVAYVEAVNGEWVTISEMNYNCFACKSVRTLRISDWRIKGYVY